MPAPVTSAVPCQMLVQVAFVLVSIHRSGPIDDDFHEIHSLSQTIYHQPDY